MKSFPDNPYKMKEFITALRGAWARPTLRKPQKRVHDVVMRKTVYSSHKNEMLADVSICYTRVEYNGDKSERGECFRLNSAELAHLTAHAPRYKDKFRKIAEKLRHELQTHSEYRTKKRSEIEKAAVRPLSKILPCLRPMSMKNLR